MLQTCPEIFTQAAPTAIEALGLTGVLDGDLGLNRSVATLPAPAPEVAEVGDSVVTPTPATEVATPPVDTSAGERAFGVFQGGEAFWGLRIVTGLGYFQGV